MFYYIFVFSLTTILGLVIDKSEKSPRNKKKQVNFCYLLVFIVLALFVGLRDVSVGSDSTAYEYKFELAANAPLQVYLRDYFYSDPGFYAFTWLLKHIGLSVNAYFLVISVIYFGVFIKFIKTYSSSALLSIWLLSALGFTTFALSTLRQSLAMAFCLLAYMLWNDKKRYAWLSLVLAFLFHNSSIIFLPMMFVGLFLDKKLPWKMLLILGTTIVVAPYAMNYLMLNVEDGYYVQTEVGGVGMIVMLSLFVFLGIISFFPYKRSLPITHYYEFIGVCFALASFLITRFNLAAMRLFLYYLVFAIVFIPNAIKNTKPNQRVIWSTAIILISTYYLVARVMADPYEESRLLLPYNFFWE